MTALWHILWPGWQTVLGSIWLGLLSMPFVVPVQLWLMKIFSRRAAAKATLLLHERILTLERER